VAYELLWALPFVGKEIEQWRARALAIPEGALRVEALNALGDKRVNSDGSALFSILAGSRNSRLLHLLVAYEFMADYLDEIDERQSLADVLCGRRLHFAMVDALERDRPVRDYYSRRLEDNGYLCSLVETCREGAASLPSYGHLCPLVIQVARLAQVQGLNHECDPKRRDAALKRWAAEEFPGERTLSWFEVAGAASAWLGVHALLALSAQSGVSRRDGLEVCASYRWISLSGTMLDSLGDLGEDLASGAHSYISHYSSQELAMQRLREFLRRSTHGTRGLRDGHRHAVIVACMMAMYLSKDSVRTPQMRATTAGLVRAGGPLVRLLVPVLRLWRIAYGQQSA
jgi:tetraprenyl-beta-curcumene synthase